MSDTKPDTILTTTITTTDGRVPTLLDALAALEREAMLRERSENAGR